LEHSVEGLEGSHRDGVEDGGVRALLELASKPMVALESFFLVGVFAIRLPLAW
jgi:hypothetical protein